MPGVISPTQTSAESGANLHRRPDRGALRADDGKKLSQKCLPESTRNMRSITMQNIIFVPPRSHQPKDHSSFPTKGPLINILPVNEAGRNTFVDDNVGGTDIVVANSEG